MGKTIQHFVWIYIVVALPILVAQFQLVRASEELPTEEDYFASIPRVTSVGRLEKSVFELGASVTIIDREMIEASTAIEIPDLLRLVPGFQVTYATGATFTVNYHGASDQWPRRMEVMVDGRSVYMNTFSAVEWSALGIAIEDIERIEVVRGPNAPTFGSNAMLGSINIITRAPFLVAGKYLRGTFGSLNTENIVARWGGTIGDWDTSLTVQYQADDGFDDVNDHKQLKDLRFRGDYQFTPVDNVSVQLGLTDGESGADGQSYNPLDPFRDRDIRSHYQQLTWDRAESDGSQYQLNLYHQYFESDDGYALDMSTIEVELGLPAGSLSFLGFPPGTTVPLGPAVVTAQRYDLEFQHDLVPQENWRLAWGLGVRYDELSSDLLLVSEGEEVEKYSGRLFGSVEWELIDDIMLNLDVLTEIHESYGTETSPRIALNWLASDTRSFRASASRSYRVLSLLERFYDFPVIASNGKLFPVPALVKTNLHDDFTPEQVTAYELGYTESWNDLGLFLDLRLFREELDDTVWEDRVNGTLLLFDEGGGWDTTGLDVQLDYRLTRDTRLVGAYSYAEIDGEINDETDDISRTKITEFKPMDNTVPRHTLSLLLSHQFNPQWRGSLTLYHMDDVEWLGNGGEVDDYTRLDLKLVRDFRLGDGDGQISFIVQNLTDNEYNEFRAPGTHDRLGNTFDRRTYLQMSMKFD